MSPASTRTLHLHPAPSSPSACTASRPHWTFADTDAAPVIVKVHVFLLLPPLEHVPDQIASRPFDTLSVIEVPLANDADPELPTDTLMPDGLDVIRSPLRPVAVTVTVAFCPAGVTVSVAVRVTLPAVAVTVTGVDAATVVVAIAKVALVAPCDTVTLAGADAALLLSLSATTNPPDGAAAVNVTVPWDAVPPTTDAGLTDTAESAGVTGAACGVKLRTDDQAPAVPAELTPRTRHQCCRTASEATVNCDAVTVCSTTRGAENALESSM